MHIVNAFLRFTKLSLHRFRSAFSENDRQQRLHGNGGGGESDSLLPQGRQHSESESRQSLGSATPSLTSRFRGFSQSMGAVHLCLFHATIYYLAAVVGFSYLFEDFAVIDSLYLASVTFTTIGYGDLSPTTPEGKVFTLVLATYGIVLLGVFIGIAGDSLVDMYEAKEEERKAALKEPLKVIGVGGRSVVGAATTAAATEPSPDDGDSLSDVDPNSIQSRSLWGSIWHVVVLEAPVVSVAMAIAIGIGYAEGWSMLDSLYWLCVSGYTIGYGDVVPLSPNAKLACVFFLPFCAAVLGEFLSRIASTYMSRKQQKTEREFLSKTLTLCDIKNLDLDQDGRVDLAEFLRYMLVAMQKVDKDDIDELVETFNRLDADKSGTMSLLCWAMRVLCCFALQAPESENRGPNKM